MIPLHPIVWDESSKQQRIPILINQAAMTLNMNVMALVMMFFVQQVNVIVTAWVYQIRNLFDKHYPESEKIIMDNLNTYNGTYII